MGARDVLEFEKKDEMEFILSEASGILEGAFEWVKPCSSVMVSKSFLAWVRVWKVSLGAWNTRFFETVGNDLGHFVCVDGITSRRERLDYERVLVDAPNPLIEQQYMDIDVYGTVYCVLVEKRGSNLSRLD